MSEVSIRQLTESDLESYWSLRMEALTNNPEAFAITYEETMERENPKQSAKNSLQTQDSATFGAFKDGELVGVVTVRWNTLHKFTHKASLLGMYVSGSARGFGVGKKIVEKAIEEARLRNIEQIQLMVVSGNEKGKRLYESLGFQTYGVEKRAMKYNGQYYDEELMVLFL